MTLKFCDAVEAPNDKHQIPNNNKIPISNDPSGCVLEFGDWMI